MTVIDAHLHVWDVTQRGYEWLGPDVAPINRSFAFDEVRPELRSAGVKGVVLVQAAETLDEEASMLRVAARNPEVRGVVSWAPLDSPASVADFVRRAAREPRLVGLRGSVFEERGRHWRLRPSVDEGLAQLASADLSLDVLLPSPAALSALPALSERHPGLRMVLDHLGSPAMGGSSADHREWRAALAVAAGNPLMHAKLSGLHPRTGSRAQWTLDDLRPVIATALDLFGPSRLMIGSDWPVAELAGGYARVWSATAQLARELAANEHRAILGDTASTFYRLAIRKEPPS